MHDLTLSLTIIYQRNKYGWVMVLVARVKETQLRLRLELIY